MIEAAISNGPYSPDTIGRPSKLSKEEIVGLYRALEIYLEQDHEATWRKWARRVERIDRHLSSIPAVATRQFVPEEANRTPQLNVCWDEKKIPLSREQVVESLRQGNPRVELRPLEDTPSGLDISVRSLESRDDLIVVRRIRECLQQT